MHRQMMKPENQMVMYAADTMIKAKKLLWRMQHFVSIYASHQIKLLHDKLRCKQIPRAIQRIHVASTAKRELGQNIISVVKRTDIFGVQLFVRRTSPLSSRSPFSWLVQLLSQTRCLTLSIHIFRAATTSTALRRSR